MDDQDFYGLLIELQQSLLSEKIVSRDSLCRLAGKLKQVGRTVPSLRHLRERISLIEAAIDLTIHVNYGPGRIGQEPLRFDEAERYARAITLPQAVQLMEMLPRQVAHVNGASNIIEIVTESHVHRNALGSLKDLTVESLKAAEGNLVRLRPVNQLQLYEVFSGLSLIFDETEYYEKFLRVAEQLGIDAADSEVLHKLSYWGTDYFGGRSTEIAESKENIVNESYGLNRIHTLRLYAALLGSPREELIEKHHLGSDIQYLSSLLIPKSNSNMRTIKLFLAASINLVEDRQKVEVFIRRKNEQLARKGIYLSLTVCEDFDQFLSKSRKQDDYNESIRSSDVFVLLASTEGGRYAREEFEVALSAFQQQGKPKILTYFRDPPVRLRDIERDAIRAFWEFQDRLEELGHFWVSYEGPDELAVQIGQQIDMLLASLE